MPVGIVGTVWGVINLKAKGVRTPAKIDWLGNATFALGLVALLTGIVYGIEPYGRHTMGWSDPWVLAALIGGVLMLCLFVWIETRVASPMFRIPLFRIRSFAAGNVASLMAALGRGGLMFVLIIWLQGIWLPEHGLQLRSDAALGGHLHAAPDRWLPPRRAAVRATSRTTSERGPSPPAGCSRQPRASRCWSCCRSTSPMSGSASCCWPTAWPWACSPRPTGPPS